MKRVLLILICLFWAAIMANAQITKVQGVVQDAENGEPIPGASVLIDGTKVGVVTDVDGKFTLTNLPTGAKQLKISCVGMVPQVVKIKPFVTVQLATNDKALNEVMVVAYGTATKATFTGSASVIDSKEIEGRLVSDVSNTLSGAVAGVQAMKGNGQPGTGSSIRVRGIGSMAASSAPLYVVDGMQYDGDISSINTQDIESMTVLKDAAAGALYGARGANGVILITTKKGKHGQPAKITLEGRWGFNSREIKNYRVLKSTNQYYEQVYQSQYNNAIYNLKYSAEDAFLYVNSKLATITGYQIYNIPNGQYLVGRNGKVNPLATLGYCDGEYTYLPDDWEKESFKNGLRQEYVATISGANDRMTYYLSAGYLNDKGVIVNSGFKRMTTRLNVDYQALKWLKVGTNLTYTNTDSKYPGDQTSSGTGNAFSIANNIAPVYPMYSRDANGNIKYNGDHPVYDYGDGSTTSNYSRNWNLLANPIGDLTYKNEQYLMDVLNGQLFAEVSPIEGLKLTAKYGLLVDNTRYRYSSSPLYGQSAAYGGDAEQEHTRTYGLNQQYLATWTHDFGQHSIDFLAGYESYDYQYENSYAYGQNLYKTDDFTVGNTIDQRKGSGSHNEYVTKGVFFRANYNYDLRYFASASYRRDGSSRFAPGHRWGNFWSGSAAWELAHEQFMKNARWIDMLKLKASFGQQGNDNLGNGYAYVDQFSVTGSDGVFSDGTLVYKGNENITWEKSNSFNTGVDFDFWHGKLAGSIEYFNRTTKDMLYNKPIAPSNGYSSIPMNIGSMRNQGLEVDLNSKIFDTNDLTWEVNFNVTYLRNKVLELHPDLQGELISGNFIYREGDPVYQLYLVEWAGVNPTNGKATYWAKNTGETESVKDAYGNDIAPGKEYVTESWSTAYSTDRKAQGNLMAPVYGGLGTTLRWHGFDLSVQCAYQLGGKIYDSGYQTLMHCGSTANIGQNWHKDILNAWTPTNTNTDVPRLCADDLYTNSTCNRFVISSNYFSLNNVTLGYTLPAALTRKAHISTVRIYASADNVALASARRGLDPRTSYTASSNDSYSALRTLTLGVKLGF